MPLVLCISFFKVFYDINRWDAARKVPQLKPVAHDD